MELVIKNYRCFSDEKPVRLRVEPGFTALLGPNNSGKSTLLKLFYEFRSLFENARSARPSGALHQATRGGRPSFNLPSTLGEARPLFCNRNQRDLTVSLEHGFPRDGEGRGGHQYIFPERMELTVPRATHSFIARLVFKGEYIAIQEIGGGGENEIRINNPSSADITEYVNAIKDYADTLYIGPSRNALNVAANQPYFDIQVGQAFLEAWRNAKSGADSHKNELCYQVMRDLEGLFGFPNLDINAAPDGTGFQLFIDGKSYRLSDLGSGFSHFFIVLFNVATRAPAYLLVDEPELGLHPTLQVKFLTTLGKYARKGVMFATHSMGLARAVADRIYSVSIGQGGNSEVAPIEKESPLSRFLGDLTYSGFSECGFSKLLLVEGTTEIKVFQHFLRLLKKELQVLILHLGGASMINGQRESELLELKRITPNVYAMIDSERTQADGVLLPSRVAFVDLCKRYDVPCEVLKLRATENYFPDRAIKAALGDSYSQLAPYEKVGEHRPSWSKNMNWQIAREMTSEELNRTDIGRFLAGL